MKNKIKETQLYETEINAIKKELYKLPKGQMTMKRSFFYETVGNVQKGITKDKLKVKQLARKAYLLKRLKHLEWNYSLVKTQAGRYKTEDPMDIIRELPSFYQTLPFSYFFHPLVQNQSENISEGNTMHKDELIYLTNSGILVRSKSERTIADMLDQNGIPYQYEAALTIGGEIRRPDFTVHRPFDGKMVLWEHFGRMDDLEYRQRTNKKLAFYNLHEFYPYKNLICTYEQDLQDSAYIQVIIEALLLR